MGRVKIDIKKIENVTSRQVTFSKRKAGLFKKCRELSVLCDAEVATMIFSHTGRYYGYASSGCMRSTIERYTSIDRTIDFPLMEIENYPVMDILARDDMGEINGARLELSSLKLKRRTLEKIYNILMGEDLDILSWDCLEVYENIMVSAFSKVKAKKEELFIEKEARYQHKIQYLEAQNRNQQKMIQETQSFIARLPSFINKDIMNFSLNIDPYVMNINPYGGSFY